MTGNSIWGKEEDSKIGFIYANMKRKNAPIALTMKAKIEKAVFAPCFHSEPKERPMTKFLCQSMSKWKWFSGLKMLRSAHMEYRGKDKSINKMIKMLFRTKICHFGSHLYIPCPYMQYLRTCANCKNSGGEALVASNHELIKRFEGEQPIVTDMLVNSSMTLKRRIYMWCQKMRKILEYADISVASNMASLQKDLRGIWKCSIDQLHQTMTVSKLQIP